MRYIFSILLIVLPVWLTAQKNYRVRKLEFNSGEYSEMAPMIYQNGIVFSSNKKNSVILVTTDQDNNYPYNLYYVEKKGDKWGKPSLFSPGISSRLSESSSSISSDFNTIYITRSQMAAEKVSQIQKADTKSAFCIFGYERGLW